VLRYLDFFVFMWLLLDRFGLHPVFSGFGKLWESVAPRGFLCANSGKSLLTRYSSLLGFQPGWLLKNASTRSGRDLPDIKGDSSDRTNMATVCFERFIISLISSPVNCHQGFALAIARSDSASGFIVSVKAQKIS
jgi:hypothetical protein